MEETAPYSLMSELEKVAGKGRPPIHLWHPDNVKDIDMEIRADGSWHYLGTPILRQRLAHLFSTVLRREGNDYFLVTPVEKCRIRVLDAPFAIVLMANEGDGRAQEITFTTNMADVVPLDDAHALRVEGEEGTRVYIEVRDGLDARLNRNVYYQLAEIAVTETCDDGDWLGIWSGGSFHRLARAPGH